VKIIAPEKLTAGDFDRMAPQSDAFARQHGQAKLLIDASACGGWDSLKGLRDHIGLVRIHPSQGGPYRSHRRPTAGSIGWPAPPGPSDPPR
jgi:hypothetical protein